MADVAVNKKLQGKVLPKTPVINPKGPAAVSPRAIVVHVALYAPMPQEI
jgi:hypothetical protein